MGWVSQAQKLGWAQVYMLKDTLRRSFYYYEDNGGLTKNVDFSLDDQILDKLKTGSYY